MDGLGGPDGGPPRGVAGHTWGSTLEPLLFLGFHSYALEEGLHSCAFWIFVLNYPTPWDFLQIEVEGQPSTLTLSHIHAIAMIWLLSPSPRNSSVEPKGCLGSGGN